MSSNTNHRRQKHDLNAYQHGTACTNGAQGPASQIPGLSQTADTAPEERTRGRRVGIFESDSDYVKLAKQGGQRGLLWHEETNVMTKPNAQYKPPDWFSETSEAAKMKSPTKRSDPDSMTSEEIKKSPTKEVAQRPDAPFGSDNKSTWERDADSFTSGKEKAADQMQKLSLTPGNYQEANKYKRTAHDKKSAPVDMSKLLSFGYVEDEKSPNDDDASSMTSEPASFIAPEEELE